MKRALKLFLVYALLWPVSLGDKMVQLAAPSAVPAECSTPWTFYRDLGRTLFGQAQGNSGGPIAMRVDSRPEPPSLLPVLKPSPSNAARPLRPVAPPKRTPVPRAAPEYFLPVPPPAPLAFQVDSKK